jgi:hypothetical protein
MKKQLKTITSILLFGVFIFLGFSSGEGNDTEKVKEIVEKIEIGHTYTFFDGQSLRLQCNECDPIWCIKFTNENTCELWTRPNNSDHQSCKSNAKYSYDKNNQTITILSISNSNISNECLDKFIGKWQWKKGAFGERFYSIKYSDCDFS